MHLDEVPYSPHPCPQTCMPTDVGQTLEHRKPTSTHPLKEIDFSRSHQLPISPQLREGLSMLDFLMVLSCAGLGQAVTAALL